jgi:hypothetical protein
MIRWAWGLVALLAGVCIILQFTILALRAWLHALQAWHP